MASRMKGVQRVRRLMRNLPEAMRKQMISVLNSGGRGLVSAIRAKAPKKTGALAAGISYRVLEKSMRLRVGLLGTKRGRAGLFYGRIQDLGRKGQDVLVQRRRRVASDIGDGQIRNILRTRRRRKMTEDIVTTYTMRVRPMAPKRFITGRFPDLRSAIKNALNGIWSRALRSMASGNE